MDDKQLFDFGIVRRLGPSPRGSLTREMSNVNCAYLARGSLECDILDGYGGWVDGGTPGLYALVHRLGVGVRA